MNVRMKSALLGCTVLMTAQMNFSVALAADEVNIYSYRQPELIQPLVDTFKAETGITVNQVFLDKGLTERIAAEGENSPADVILATDIGRLQAAVDAGVTQSVEDTLINENIPAQYRDPAGNWFGLTVRGRVVYASNTRVEQDAITYEELADPKWKGKICIRDGQHDYNIALFASMISNLGAEKAETWMSGLKENLARKPAGNDREQAKSIFSGECDLAIGNTYYVGLMQTNEKQPEQKEWAKSIKVLFPNAADRGTHVNLSGMALARYAPNKDNAIKFMEYLASPKAQEIYAEQVFEYPVAPGTSPSEIVKGFGDLKADTLAVSELAKNRKMASEMVDKTRFNDGPSN